MPAMVVLESYALGSNLFEIGQKVTPTIPWYGVPLSTKRDDKSGKGRYLQDLKDMEGESVGGDKGAPDRSIVADSVHGVRKEGQMPLLARTLS